MKAKTRLILFIMISIFSFFTFFSFSAAAQIYKSVDENGVATFSDQPNAKSEAVTLGPENVSKRPIPSVTATNTTNATDASQQPIEREDYTAFTISSPKDQDTFQNATEIPVSVDISPALQKDDTIEFYLDGVSVAPPATNTSIMIPKIRDGKEFITRGSHTISASIFNVSGEKLMTTPPITIFIHYTSVAIQHK